MRTPQHKPHRCLVHTPNPRDTATAALRRQGRPEFFLAGPRECLAGATVLSSAAPAALLPPLEHNQRSALRQPVQVVW